MEKKDTFTKILTIVGTILVWFPLLAPVIFSAVRLLQARRFLFDFLMPAELFPFALAGSLLLLLAAFRAHLRRGLISWGLIIAVIMLVGGQALAVVTGLANGETAMGGWQWALVLTTLVIFVFALVAVAAGGILLLWDLYKPTPGQPVTR